LPEIQKDSKRDIGEGQNNMKAQGNTGEDNILIDIGTMFLILPHGTEFLP
jgi:hypothetical protein